MRQRLHAARFALDTRSALRNSPAAIIGGAETSEGTLSLAAYPALVVRHALRTRILDFRLPDYAGAPVVDPVDTEHVFLRKGPAGAPTDVHPSLHFVRVRRGRSSGDDGTEDPSNLRLPLWWYARTDAGKNAPPPVQRGTWHEIRVRRAKVVLLMHAFGMSGSTYTLRTIDCNLAEFLYRQGYEVWIFDSRMSPRVAGSSLQSTLDQVGLIDAPAAVDKILSVLEGELGEGAPLQISCFAHCLGAGATLIGLLGGRISHPVQAATASRPMLPKISALVCSQVHPFMVGSNHSMSKTWVAPAIRNLLGRTHVPLSVRGPVTSIVDQLLDRAFASLVPHGEQCPKEGEVRRIFDDDCATCRRIRFMDGALFRHKNLGEETHRALPRLFGPANVRLFAHGSKMLDYERLVTEDGINAYATDEAVARYLALPIRFVHGGENDLFDAESAVRSSAQFARLQPAFSRAFKSGAVNATHHIVQGYGHLDLLIGSSLEKAVGAVPAVYAQLTRLLDQAWQQPEQPGANVDATESAARDVRFPALGPWVSPAQRDADGELRVGVAFAIDDLTQQAAAAGSTLHATAIAHEGRVTRATELQIKDFPAPLVARDGYLLPKPGTGPHLAIENAPSVRVAYGRLALPSGGGALRVELVTHSDLAGLSQPSYSRSAASMPVPGSTGAVPTMNESRLTRTHAAGLASQAPLNGRATYRPASGILAANELRNAISRARGGELRGRIANDVPYPATPSELRRNPVRASNRWLHVRAGVLGHMPADPEVRIAIGCCRYPGFPFDVGRADETFARLLRIVRGDRSNRPHACLMLGDQIYADATAGLDDPLGAIERFHRRHASAFATPAMRRLMAALPVVMTPDDHEFRDNYPTGTPLYDGGSRSQRYAALREAALRAAAEDAVTAFQFMTQDAASFAAGCYRFEIGKVRVIVLDTRSNRKQTPNGLQILSSLQRQVLTDWVETAGPDTMQIVCSGSVVLPALCPGADPANPGPSDSWDSVPSDRSWLLGLLADKVPRRFVLLSGDYHITTGAEVLDRGHPVGIAVVAPPFYAPLSIANSVPSDLLISEVLTDAVHRFSLGRAERAQVGSGFGLLRLKMQSEADHDPIWTVTLEADIDDQTAGAKPAPGWTGLRRTHGWTL